MTGVALAALTSMGLAAPANAQDTAPDTAPPANDAEQDDGIEEAVSDYVEGEAPPPVRIARSPSRPIRSNMNRAQTS